MLHRRIPPLPSRPRQLPVSGHITRSYPVGRQNYFRAYQGQGLKLGLTTEQPLPSDVHVRLTTTMNGRESDAWISIPFDRVNDQTQECLIYPENAGMHRLRAEFSLDNGLTWLRDTVPDAWVLVDPPQTDAVRIYTLIPAVSGTLTDWKTELKRIAEMGFNAVHMLPLTPLDTSNSPYAAKELFGIDESYVMKSSEQDGLSQLDEFVEFARELKIQLCFDLVLNHIGVNSSMTRLAPEWIVPDQQQPDGFKRAWFWSSQGKQSWDDIVLINYEHPSEATRLEIFAYMTDYALFWAKYADYTGGFVRLDNLHGSDLEFMRVLTSALHEEFPRLAVLAEYFTDEQTLLTTVPRWGLNLVLATPWNYRFVPQLREYLSYIHRISGQVRFYMPVTTHDSGSPAEEFATADSTVPRYVAAALLGTGATGIPQGVELGEQARLEFIGKQPRAFITDDARFASFIAKVNSILAENPAFRCGENIEFVDDGHEAIIAAFRRGSTENESFLVACNFDMHASHSLHVDLTPTIGSSGPFPCSELLSGDEHTFVSPIIDLFLPPCSAQVLRFPAART